MTENKNQRKEITGSQEVWRYAGGAGLASFVVFILIFFLLGFIFLSSLSDMDSGAHRISPADMNRIVNLIFLPIHFICSLIALLIAALSTKKRYDPWALLYGSVYFFAFILIPALFFRSFDESPYRWVSTGAYLFLVILYYCIGFYAFRKKAIVVAAENKI